MDPNEPDFKETDDLCNTEPEEETILREKKRRRVSFADNITSVHVFDRDEDSGTPPNTKQSFENDGQGHTIESAGIRSDDKDSDDSKDKYFQGSEDDDSQEQFLRNMESPGSVAGSTTSNEEDKFFGPVSASFIRSGMQSESPFSDDSHDITMDSTAFTFQFRSLMKSDERWGNSVGNTKTLTGLHLTYDYEKTPTEGSAHSDGSFMVLTEVNRPKSQYIGSDEKSIGGGDSNDMSLIVEDPDKYDYARLSPRLVDLLAEAEAYKASKSPGTPSLTSNFKKSSDCVDLKDSCNEEVSELEAGTAPVKMVSNAKTVKLLDADVDCGTAAFNQSSPSNPSSKVRAMSPACNLNAFQSQVRSEATQDIPSGTHDQQRSIEFPNKEVSDLISKSMDITEHGSAAAVLIQPIVSEAKHINGSRSPSVLDARQYTPGFNPIPDKECESPIAGSVSTLFAKRKNLFQGSVVSLSNIGGFNPFAGGQSCSLGKEDIKHAESISSMSKTHSTGFPKLKVLPLNFYDSSEGSIEIPILHSSQMLRNSELRKTEQMPTVADKSFSSPGMKFGSNGSPLRILNLQKSLDKHIDTCSAKSCREDCIGDATSLLEHSTARPECIINSNFFLKENRGPLTMLSHVTNSNEMGNTNRCKDIANEEIYHQSMQKESDSCRDYLTPLKHGLTPSRFGSQTWNFHSEIDQTKLKGETQIDGVLEASSFFESVSPEVCMRTTSPRDSAKSSMGLEPLSQNVSNKVQNAPCHHGSISPEHVQGLRRYGDEESHKIINIFDRSLVEAGVDLLRKKERSEEIPLLEKCHTNETGRSHTNPEDLLEMEGSTSGFPSANYMLSGIGMERFASKSTSKHSGDVISRFSEATKQLFSSSLAGLNSQELSVLEDKLGQLQKVIKYRKLCSEILPKDQIGDLRKQRVEAAFWQHNALVYEQAKLQLMHAKRDILLKKVQKLKSGIQQCHNLRANSSQHLHVPGITGDQNEGHLPSVPAEPNGSKQIILHRVTTMGQELEVLDQKVKNITKSLQASCKLKGSLSSDETITLAKDYVEKKMRCRLIHEDIQQWKLDDIEYDRTSIVLKYGNLLSQRLVINGIGPVSSMEMFLSLNDADIGKLFPGIDASAAFKFVFIAGHSHKLCSPKSIQQETQVTGYLLGNLLDLLKEVLVARMELPLLFHTRFHSPSVQQLQLQLYFIDCKASRKATVVLDMTDLNCAAYPSEILPSQIQILNSRTLASKSSLLAEITDAVKSLKVGPFRIFRLCQCISRVLQASNRWN